MRIRVFTTCGCLFARVCVVYVLAQDDVSQERQHAQPKDRRILRESTIIVVRRTH